MYVKLNKFEFYLFIERLSSSTKWKESITYCIKSISQFWSISFRVYKIYQNISLPIQK